MSEFAYFPHTPEDISLMLERIGVKDMKELYSDMPERLLYKKEYELPDAMSEQQVRDYFNGLAAMDVPLKVFVGAGAYDHYTPSVIPYLTSRSEFITAYTPYQSEVSQGTLRYIFEYQSMICALTGMDFSNACMYDGPTAAAEAMRMCIACTRKRSKVLVSKALLPNVIATVRTYAKYYGTEIIYAGVDEFETSHEDVKNAAADPLLAGAILPSVNRYGVVENHEGLADILHASGALLVEYCDPSALAVVRTPAEWGADIAVGDAQTLGIPLCYGGPYVGFMAVRNEHLRKMPGRIVGETRDAEGRRSFVLTLQAREQHIRREKATSNICSNESLMALWVTIYLSLIGPAGMRKVNALSYAGAHRLHDELIKTGKFEKVCNKPFIKEFVLKPLCDIEKLQQKLIDAGYFAALKTEEGYVSFCVTEKRSAEEIDGLIKVVKEL